jgi:hypothetical protein
MFMKVSVGVSLDLHNVTFECDSKILVNAVLSYVVEAKKSVRYSKDGRNLLH